MNPYQYYTPPAYFPQQQEYEVNRVEYEPYQQQESYYYAPLSLKSGSRRL